ncbi:MAG: hypothetical protein EA420_03195 [Candidatus Competibacteraceae bacterium]|nr:MAG: hypothetical protein EA420_03195 [Candidatus Competibacteraceae bacterium]
MKPLYIFDLDGTLALNDHRTPILKRESRDKWKDFYAACDKDLPNHPVIRVMESLRIFADIWIFSGRSDEVRDKTVRWLADHTSFLTAELEGPMLVMRAEGDYTVDHVLKKQWFDLMLYSDRARLVAVFDDRDQVVKMWRDAGVTCFQVADGDF